MKYIKYLLTFGAINFLLIKSAKTMLSDSESANTKSGTATLTSSTGTAAASDLGTHSAGSLAGAATANALYTQAKPKLSLPANCRANEEVKASLYHKLPAQLKEACEYKPNTNTTTNTQEIETTKEHQDILELLNTLHALDNIIITFDTTITPLSEAIDRY